MKKFKENFKRFWSLQKHSTGGFTLVELIVVIAILAILAGIAVPAYSGYVEKANKQADQTLVSEVKQALELYHYSNPEATSGYVKLGPNGVVEVDNNTNRVNSVGAKAMEAMFGANWEEVAALKYDKWQAESGAIDYSKTNYYGQEGSLLQEVDRLTGKLGESVKTYNIDLGDGFTDFLDRYGLSSSSDAESIGNAATLYVAQQTAGKEEFISNTFKEKLSPAGGLSETYNTLEAEIGTAAALAAVYAYAEGFAQYCDKQDSSTNAVETFHSAASFENITDGTAAMRAIEEAFYALGLAGQAHIDDYMNIQEGQENPGLSDLSGYVGIMGTVNKNKDIVEGNLAAEDCFTDGTVETLLKGYASMGSMSITTSEGEVAVALTVNNGVQSTPVFPVNWNK